MQRRRSQYARLRLSTVFAALLLEGGSVILHDHLSEGAEEIGYAHFDQMMSGILVCVLLGLKNCPSAALDPEDRFF